MAAKMGRVRGLALGETREVFRHFLLFKCEIRAVEARILNKVLVRPEHFTHYDVKNTKDLIKLSGTINERICLCGVTGYETDH